MNILATKIPIHEVVYRKLREMILFGELVPGQAITIQGLVDELAVGMTPVREAIRRLMAEGALDFRGNRRVCLPEISLTQLEEIAFARNSIEPRMTFLASERLKPSDIDGLAEIDDALNRAISEGNVRAYLEQNYLFHETLYGYSEARVLMAISATLWLRLGPSLRVVCGRFGTQNLPDLHNAALTALRAGDHQGAADAIAGDIQQGFDQICSVVSERREQDLN